MIDFINDIDVSDAASITFASAMKKMASADGEVHPAEEEMIVSFLRDAQAALPNVKEDLSTIDTPELKSAFLKTLALVALVDGVLRKPELSLMQEYIDQLGYGQSAASVFEDVGKVVLNQFRGVVAFRDQAEEIGRSFGLSESAIAEVLD